MDYTDFVKGLKKYAYKVNNRFDKRIVNTNEITIDNCYVGIIENEFINTKDYEVYMFVEYKKDIAVPLLYKHFADREIADKYYKEIKTLILDKNLDKIRAEIEN